MQTFWKVARNRQTFADLAPLSRGACYFSCSLYYKTIVNNYKYVREADTATPHFSLLSPHSIINPSAQRTPQFLISNFSFLIGNRWVLRTGQVDEMTGLAKVLVGTWIQPCTGDGVHADGTGLQACTWNFDKWIAASVAGQSEGCCVISFRILVKVNLIFFILFVK